MIKELFTPIEVLPETVIDPGPFVLCICECKCRTEDPKEDDTSEDWWREGK